MSLGPRVSRPKEHVSTRFFGIPLTCLKPHINQPLKSNASANDKFVDAYGNNLKKLVGAEDAGTTKKT